MSYKSITRFERSDCLINCNDIELLGFDKTKTQGEMIDLAVQYGACMIVRNGDNGKWYLKGLGRDSGVIREKLERNVGKYREGVYSLFIDYR